MIKELWLVILAIGSATMALSGYWWSVKTLQFNNDPHPSVETRNKELGIILSCLLFFIMGAVLTILPLEQITSSTPTVKKYESDYVLFLDTSVIKNEGDVDSEALNILNMFLESTKANIVIISDNRFNRFTLVIHNIDVIKLICANYGIKGSIIGAIPYTEGKYTKHQEIKLWRDTTRIKINNCVIIDDNIPDEECINRTIKIDGLLTSKHMLNIIKMLETPYDPNIFNMRTQNYDEIFRARKQTSG